MSPTTVEEAGKPRAPGAAQLKEAAERSKCAEQSKQAGTETHLSGVLKSKLVRKDERKPIADDYEYDLAHGAPLPTLDILGVDIDEHDDPSAIGKWFLDHFAAATEDAEQFTALFIPDGSWRDKVAFTWDYRTFHGTDVIRSAAADLLPLIPVSDLKLLAPATIVRLWRDLAWIAVHFTFHTDRISASGVANLVKTKEGFKVWTLCTAIEGLLRFPEAPSHDGHPVGDLSWAEQRQTEIDFGNRDPDVVIIGGGHNGLMLAARLKALGVSSLIIERNARIGDTWRQRYDCLTLQFPHWGDHFPYMPFPDHWPTYTPAHKLGDWLKSYYTAMELCAWTSTSVQHVEQLPDGSWSLVVNRNGTERTLKPKQLVMATSLFGEPSSPPIPGRETFSGTVIHSTEYRNSAPFVGKKVLVVGASSSGLDIAHDLAMRGIDVTLLQRSPTYVMSLTHSVPMFMSMHKPNGTQRPDLEGLDRGMFSTPTAVGENLSRRFAEDLEALDHDLLQGLEEAGFKTWRGQRDTGFQTLAYTNGGAYYFEAGACESIIKGDIKVEQGSLERIEDDMVVWSNEGSEISRQFDTVLLATGFRPAIDGIRAALGESIANRIDTIWGIDSEGELRGVFRHCGVNNLWIVVSILPYGRYHSKLVALRIKAMLEGVHGTVYQ
ncbi:FAD/NAD(P)-binding domain-containing protein [Cutaneotrichosporon oleaginosum]|uniref:FAD/NAD(P)-binding domain-containing protein n=1 Tax=Cutaneotrichosporon oleaginosum TaxID=879819 RepID=A0A0J0XRB1_9TREE|nr:FAD/NAD(P)-binding domain-containing protein [Cutaneotrichosporon oleaginosum]KLT43676.1 FAD/NAD(P)-binding domain-containing protein [Cutaneotrichosporon oleaginosum]